MFNKIANLLKAVLSVFNPSSKKVKAIQAELDKAQTKYTELKEKHKEIKGQLEAKVESLTNEVTKYQDDIAAIKEAAKAVKAVTKTKK